MVVDQEDIAELRKDIRDIRDALLDPNTGMAVRLMRQEGQLIALKDQVDANSHIRRKVTNWLAGIGASAAVGAWAGHTFSGDIQWLLHSFAG